MSVFSTVSFRAGQASGILSSSQTQVDIQNKLEDINARVDFGLFTQSEAHMLRQDAMYSMMHEGPKTMKDFKPTPTREVSDYVDYVESDETLPDSIDDFTYSGYREVSNAYRKNKWLKAVISPEGQELYKDMEKLFSVKGHFKGEVYRGNSVPYGTIEMLEEGMMLRNSAPLSSTTNSQVAEDFARNDLGTRDTIKNFDEPVLYTINTEHAPGHKISPWSSHGDEREVLLPPNSLFQIQSIETGADGITRVDLTTNFNDPELLAVVKNSMPDAPINNKILGYTALAVVLGVGGSTEAEAAKISPVSKITKSVVAPQRADTNYTADFTAGALASKLPGWEMYSEEYKKQLIDYTVKQSQKKDNVLTIIEQDLQRTYDELGDYEFSLKSQILDTYGAWFKKDEVINGAIDKDWMNQGRDQWFKDNQGHFSQAFIEHWDDLDPQDLPVNYAQAVHLFTRYEKEEQMNIRAEKMEGAMPFIADLGLSMFSAPAVGAEASAYALYLATKNPLAKVSLKTWQRYGGFAVLSGGMALGEEELRQHLAGIDLNNEKEVAILGTVFGIGVLGVFDAGKWGLDKMWRKSDDVPLGLDDLPQEQQKEEFIKASATAKLLIDAEKRLSTGIPLSQYTPTPTTVPKIENINWATISPIANLYSLGLPKTFDVISKIVKSPNTLTSKGNIFINDVPTVDNLYRTVFDNAYNKYEKTIVSLQKQSGLNNKDFNDSFQLAKRQLLKPFKERREDIKYLREQISSYEAKVKVKGSKTVVEDTTRLQGLQHQLTELEATPVVEARVENEFIKQAVEESNSFYKVFNDKRYMLAERKLAKETSEKVEKAKVRYADDPVKLEESLKDIDTHHKASQKDLKYEYEDAHLAYNPIYYDKNIFSRATPEELKAYRSKIKDALLNGPKMKSLKKYGTPDEVKAYVDTLDEVADRMTTNIRTANTHNLLRDVGADLKSGSGDVTRAKSENYRQVSINEEDVLELTNDEMFALTQRYGWDTGHKLSVREIFDVDNADEWHDKVIQDVSTEILDNQYNIKGMSGNTAVQYFQGVLESALGIRGVASPDDGAETVFKTMRNVNNSLYGAGFMPIQLTEIPLTVRKRGYEFIKQIIPGMARTFKDYSKQGFKEGDIDDINGIIIGNNIQQTLIASRVDDGMMHYNPTENVVNRVEQGSAWLADKAFHLGGFSGLLNTMNYASIGAGISKTMRVATRLKEGGKLSTVEVREFARHGLSEEDLYKIADQPGTIDGKLNYSMKGWDPVVAAKVEEYLHYSNYEAILHPTHYSQPLSLTSGKSGLMNTIGQYLKIPLESHNRLYKNNMNDSDYYGHAAMFSTVGLMGALLYSKELYSIAVGAKESYEAKYQIDHPNPMIREEATLALLSDTLTSSLAPTYFTKPIEMMSSFVGKELPGREYTFSVGSAVGGPSLGQLESIGRSIKKTHEDEEVGQWTKKIPILGKHWLLGPPLEAFGKKIDER